MQLLTNPKTPATTAGPRANAWNRQELAILGVILLAGGFLRGYDLGGECFDCDELYAVRITGLSPKTVASVAARDGFHTNHPPLMTTPFLAWTAVFGTDEAAVRSLPFLCGLLAVVLVYLLGKQVAGPWVGLVAAAVLALNPLHIAYSREARQYALLVVLVLAAHLFFLRCLQRGHWLDRLGFFAFSLWAIFTHYFAIPALAAQGVVALWLIAVGDSVSRRAALLAVLTLALAALPFASWLPIVKYQASQSWPHLQEGTAGNLLACLAEVAGLDTDQPWLAWIGGVMLACLVGLGLWSYRHRALPVGCHDELPPLPRRLGIALMVGGVLGSVAVLLLLPGYILPMARETLQGYGYPPQTVEMELAKLAKLLVSLPLDLSLVGLVVFTWPWIIRHLEQLPRWDKVAPQSLSAAVLVGCLLLVPIVLVRVVGLLGVPFVSSRNLLILTPSLSLALAMGLAAALEVRRGQLAAAAAAGCLLFSAWQYEVVAAPFGSSGRPLGMHTGPWRDLAAAWRSREDKPPLVAAKTPSTDPLLFYLGDAKPRRIESLKELGGHGALSRFLFVHTTENYHSRKMVDDLLEARALLTPVWQQETLLLLDVELKPAGRTE